MRPQHSLRLEFGEEAGAVNDVADMMALPYLFGASIGGDFEVKCPSFNFGEPGFGFYLLSYGSRA